VQGKGFADFDAARAAYKSPAAVMALDLAEEAFEAYQLKKFAERST
jgi:hypothetical protein